MLDVWKVHVMKMRRAVELHLHTLLACEADAWKSHVHVTRTVFIAVNSAAAVQTMSRRTVTKLAKNEFDSRRYLIF
jgi:hypothetical protein